jgi:hypothetical protein
MVGESLSVSTANAETITRLSAKGRAVFTVKGWNDAIRSAAIYAGNWWIGHYGVLRFNKGYAVSALGYSAGGAKPFFKDGIMASNYSMRARTIATAKTGALVQFRVTFPAGHPLQEKTSKAFRFIPMREKVAVAREFRRGVIEALQAGRAKAAAKAQAVAARQARAAANREKREAGRARAAANRAAKERALAASDRGRARLAERRARKQADTAARRRAAAASARSTDRRRDRAYSRKIDRNLRNNERARLDPSYE